MPPTIAAVATRALHPSRMASNAIPSAPAIPPSVPAVVMPPDVPVGTDCLDVIDIGV